jgi:NADH-quinone oxidoreductase subunit L
VSLAAARLVVLLPALAAVLGLALARRAPRSTAQLVAGLGALLTLAAAAAGLVAESSSGARPTGHLLPALSAGALRVPLLLQSSRTVALLAVVVAVVGWAVQAFAGWYLREDDRYPVFAATVSLFLSGMLLVVQSADLLLTFVGWEVMGWCSYLLIGHWTRRESANRAAFKAFLVNRFADVGFFLGVVGLAAGPGSTAYREVVAHWAPSGAGTAGGLGDAAMALLVVGILGKSAQVPFHDWLPDAMEGPTPASALIHAATMVAAGTVVLAQLFDVLAASDAARWLLGVSTAVTMVWAALLAFVQPDLKRLLAYSTVSQVALMLSALAVAPRADGPGSGLVHLVSHAFFKALLFLGIGWLSVGVGTSAVALAGRLRATPEVRVAMGVGLLSLAGVPPLMGFWSKEHVLGAAEAGTGGGAGARAVLVLVAALVAVALTAAYCTRAWLVLDRPAAHVPEPAPAGSRPSAAPVPLPALVPLPARASLAVLAVLAVVGGLVLLTPWLRLPGHVSWWTVLLSLLLVAGAASAVWVSTRGATDPALLAAARLRPVSSRARPLAADHLYLVVVARPVLALARFVTVLDRDVIDAYVRGAALSARLLGRGGQRVHAAERAASGVVWVAVGVLVVAATGAALW